MGTNGQVAPPGVPVQLAMFTTLADPPVIEAMRPTVVNGAAALVNSGRQVSIVVLAVLVGSHKVVA